jgi:hypothetical protein
MFSSGYIQTLSVLYQWEQVTDNVEKEKENFSHTAYKEFRKDRVQSHI